MFDFDGTITVPGNYAPPLEMVHALVKTAKKMPISCCTGRQLESFVEHGLTTLLENIDESDKADFLKNMHLVAENGAIGYYFDLDSNEFKEFYRVDWPSEFIERSMLMERLDRAVADFGNVYFKKHKIVVVMRTKAHKSGDIKLMNHYSSQIFEICKAELAMINENYEDYVHIGNSGIGVVIGPANGDKDRGIEEFANFLREKKGLQIDEKAREIMVIGDQPLKGGNDHYFLKGRFGTAYTVGHVVEGADWPLPVFNDDGKKLSHIEGTKWLLDSI